MTSTTPDILARKAVAEPARGGAEKTREVRSPGSRRGPFRPEMWRSLRQREGVRLAPHLFRLIDLALLAAVTVAVLARLAPELAAAPLALAGPLALAAAAAAAGLKASGAYAFRSARPELHQLGRAAAATLIGAGAAGAAFLFLGSDTDAAALWASAAFLALGGAHLIYAGLVRRWREGGLLTSSVVVVGATKEAETLITRALEQRRLAVLGIFDDRRGRAPENLAGVPVLGGSQELLTHRLTAYVDRIVIAVAPAAQARVRELITRLSALPTEVTLLFDPRADQDLDAALDRLAGPAFAPLEPVNPARRAFNKRMQDLLIGGLALILLAPVMALVALAVRLDSPGPIFFRQRRHGFNHEEIVVWKFRSMRHEAADATAARQVTSDDDRVTRVGRFIRATSLDELPQLLNVITGEMSLVGPRPHAVGMKTGDVESAKLVADYAWRHRIKPGLTGWAAIHGSRGPLHTPEDVRRRVKLDIEYIERQSLWLDLRIMAVTLPVLLGDRLAVR
ncbi:exopolysaccharide biosynthesis polyprenyl glycosylphosphotransferase [Brevundimonas balnearis]|uniref:Exopolysaccharide biosynthesis polyprenyl glycosylphosphotransferase n=1 Tax=Brevundimonas balnearis TaxID=1572858 RepID=A0ABV6R1F7_9CAUL